MIKNQSTGISKGRTSCKRAKKVQVDRRKSIGNDYGKGIKTNAIVNVQQERKAKEVERRKEDI